MAGTANESEQAMVKHGRQDFTSLDLLPMPAFVIGKDRKISYANQVFADFLEQPREQVTASPVTSFAEFEGQGMAMAFQTGERGHFETWVKVLRTGKERYVAVDWTPIKDDQGNVQAVLELASDQTERKQVLLADRKSVV
jgi:PAS domain S-box-containing protein